MADCTVVSSKAIRVQLPGGEIYAPALLEAATRTGARSALSVRKKTALKHLVQASLAALNSGNPSTIALEMMLDGDSIDVSLVGVSCNRRTKRLVTELAALAAKKTQSFSDKPLKGKRSIKFRI